MVKGTIIMLFSLSFIIFILIISSSNSSPIPSYQSIPAISTISKEIQAHHDLDVEPPTFMTRVITHMFELFNLKQVIHDIKISKTTEATCQSCKFGMGLIQQLLQFGRGKEDIAKIAYSVCVHLRIESPKVCRGVVDVFQDELVTVLTQVTLTPSDVCGIILGDSCANVTNPLHNWTLPLTPIPKPTPRPIPSVVETPTSLLKILHLSDIHIDLDYAEGGDAVCGEPLCCRSTAKNIPSDRRAGYWGDYRDCDIPLRTFETLLQEISKNHRDLDAVFWTGDIPAHDIWNQTRQGQLDLIRKVSLLIDKYLGHVPILPALGNHESVPVNSFPRPEVTGKNSISWLYEALDDIWYDWLPSGSTMDKVKTGAYYTVPFKKGLRVVSLNMNYCNNQNWWLLLNTTDPANELTWFIHELQAAELNGDRVMVIGHIPPGSNDCLQVWSRNYYRIVNRFEDTIVGQFFGHTHQDEFQLFYDDHETSGNFLSLRPTNVAYIAPSVTTYGGLNPGYRIYSVDGKTFDVFDYETYFVNLTRVNQVPDRERFLVETSYSAKSDLKLTNLHPSQWHQLIIYMIRDTNLFKKYEKLFFNRSDSYKPCREEDWVCRADILCRLVTGRAHDYSFCHRLIQNYQALFKVEVSS